MSEHDLMQRVMLVGCKRWHARLWRNNVGVCWQGRTIKTSLGEATLHEYCVKYGLAVGSGDLIGLAQVTITPDMVGRRLPVFVSIETKAKRRREKQAQRDWRTMLTELDAIAGIVRTIEDVETLFQGVDPRET